MSNTNFKYAALTLCFLILSLGVNASELVQKTIKINSKENVLIAPESSSYKWYYNGQQLALVEFNPEQLHKFLLFMLNTQRVGQHKLLLQMCLLL